jgi:hypothetical protein
MEARVSAPAPLRLRPLEIGDLLDETFRIYRRHFLLFAGISVILAIPGAGLAGYSFFSLFSSVFQASNATQAPDFNSFLPALVVLAIGYLVNLLLAPFTAAAVIYAACESAQGRPVTIWSALRGVLRRYFAIFGYLFLIGLMGVMFCLLPLWIWIWVGWVAVLPIMFVENASLGQAMGRSWRLIQGRWWRTFLILFLLAIVYMVVGWTLSGFAVAALGISALVLSSFIVFAIVGAVSIIVSALVNPILQIALVLIYFDLRVRREGLDLFQMAYQLNAPAAQT